MVAAIYSVIIVVLSSQNFEQARYEVRQLSDVTMSVETAAWANDYLEQTVTMQPLILGLLFARAAFCDLVERAPA